MITGYTSSKLINGFLIYMTLKCDTILVIPLQILATLDYNLIRLQGNFSQIINIFLQIYPTVSFKFSTFKMSNF